MRLIDADTLRAEFTGNFGRELWHYTGIWATIDVAPTVDAVSVVRCKDCINLCKLENYNWLAGECSITRNKVTADFFCAFGNRR